MFHRNIRLGAVLLSATLVAFLGAVLVPGTAQAGGSNAHATHYQIPVHVTFRTPAEPASLCPSPEADPEVTEDCQIEWLFGDIGGPDTGSRAGAEDMLNTVGFVDTAPNGQPLPWIAYVDAERITVQGGKFTGSPVVFRGYEAGFIDASPALPLPSTRGEFVSRYKGTFEGCQLTLDFTGVIALGDNLNTNGDPVDFDSGEGVGGFNPLPGGNCNMLHLAS